MAEAKEKGLSATIEHQFRRGFAWMAIGSLVEQAANAVVFLLLARLLSPEAFGLWAMAAALLLIGETLVRETLADYLIAADYETDGLRSTIFWSLITLSIAIGAVLVGISRPLADFFREPEVAKILVAIAPIPLLLGGSAVPAAMLRRQMEFRALSLRAIAGMVGGGLVGVWLAVQGYGVWALVAQRFVLTGVNAAIAWFATDWRPRLRFDGAFLKPLFVFARGVIGLRLAELSFVQLPLIAIGALQGASVLGYFSIAWRLTELSSFLITTPLRMAAQSAFAVMNRQSGDAARLLIDLSKLSSFLALPAYAGLAALSLPFVTLIAGKAWGEAAPALSVLSIYGAYLCIITLYQSFVLAKGQPERLAIVQWTEVVVAVLLIVFIGRTGPTAPAAALVATTLICAPFRLLVVARAGGVHPSQLLLPLVRPAVGAIMMAGVILWAQALLSPQSALSQLIICILLGIAFYALWARLFLRDTFVLFFDRFATAIPSSVKQAGLAQR